MKDANLPTPVSAQEQPLRTMFRFTSPPPDSFPQSRPAFRRRYGRGGRLHIEERKRKAGPVVQTGGVVYDSDDDSDGEPAIFPVDYYDNLSMSYRAASLQSRSRIDVEQAARRTAVGGDVAMTNGQSTAGQLQQAQASQGGS